MTLSMWQIMAPSYNQPGQIGELSRRTVTDPRHGSRPIPDLSRFDWLREFRISVGGVTFTPQPLDQAHGRLRSRMFSMFASSQLGTQIWRRLVVPTLAPSGRDTRGREHDSYIEAPGNLVDPTRGDPRGIAHRPPPARSPTDPPVVGYVHTHPPSPQFLPPTVGSDWLDSSVFPVQLMVESTPGRVWGLISPNFAFPMGLLGASGALNPLDPTAPQARIIYALR